MRAEEDWLALIVCYQQETIEIESLLSRREGGKLHYTCCIDIAVYTTCKLRMLQGTKSS